MVSVASCASAVTVAHARLHGPWKNLGMFRDSSAAAIECFGRPGGSEHSELQHGRSEDDDIAVAERGGTVERLAVEHRTVLAAQIFDGGALVGDRDPRVMARRAGVVDEDRHRVGPSEHMLA